MSQIKVFTETIVNSSKIREELIDGEPHIVVPASTLPTEGIVMNAAFYSSDVIINSYKQLENTPAPLGHPVIDGQRVPSSDPRAQNAFGVGAYNRNVRVEDGVVKMEKVINKRIAESTEKGRALLKAIYDEQPIHTSTGLTARVSLTNGAFNGITYNKVVDEARFDHDAFLIGEEGAATPEQRVGVFVNTINNSEEVFNLTKGEPVMAEKNQDEKSAVEVLVNALSLFFTNTKETEKQEKKEPTVEKTDASTEQKAKASTDAGKESAEAKETEKKEQKANANANADDATATADADAKDSDSQDELSIADEITKALSDAMPQFVDAVVAKLKEATDNENEEVQDKKETMSNSASVATVLVSKSGERENKAFSRLPD